MAKAEEQKMTYQDYEKMADEYRAQAELLGKKLETRRKRRSFASAEERSEHETALKLLNEMKLDCRATETRLRNIAEYIKEADDHEESR